MYIKGLENIVTIIGKNGEVKQGSIKWIHGTDGEFWFSDGRGRQFWGKTDYWIVTTGIAFSKINTIVEK